MEVTHKTHCERFPKGNFVHQVFHREGSFFSKVGKPKGKLSYHHKFLSRVSFFSKIGKPTSNPSISLTPTAMPLHNTQEWNPILMYGLLVDLNCHPLLEDNDLGHARFVWPMFLADPSSGQKFVRKDTNLDLQSLNDLGKRVFSFDSANFRQRINPHLNIMTFKVPLNIPKDCAISSSDSRR